LRALGVTEMGREVIRIYVDTSVFGGVFDREFAEASRVFFDQAYRGTFCLVTSGLVEEEIRKAPSEVQTLFDKILDRTEVVEATEEAISLQSAYLAAGIVSERYASDALHVAVATVAKCGVLVSWNFKHIVHFQKVPKYNAVNVLKGHAAIAIWTPLEVIGSEEDEEV